MRAVIQRVKEAKVEVGGEITGAIEKGLVILLGVAKGDTEAGADWLLEKIINLRIFEDEAGKMNRSALEVNAGLLIVSQFTLYGDTRKGRRPGFDAAAKPEDARLLYDYFVTRARASALAVGTGIFQAEMLVTLANDGPVTFLIDTP